MLFFILWRFYRDVHSLDLKSYDLVISDFEPVSAWAAKLRAVPSLAIGHQSAFKYDIPKEGDDLLSRKIMEWFAPPATHIGLHWHHFQLPLLPPMIEKNDSPITTEDHKILVYLPFENIHHIIRWLEPYGNYRYYVYHEDSTAKTPAHIRLCPLSRVSFPRDLASCEGVISNAGFELASGALTLGKKIRVKPLYGQYEQLSNAKALKQLGFGEKMNTLDHDALPPWLAQSSIGSIKYPDVATTLCQWICNGMQTSLTELSRQLW